MRIAIEAQRIFRQKKHGMDFVVLEVIKQLQQIDSENEYFIFVTPGPDRCFTESSNFHLVELTTPGGYPVWEQFALPLALRKIKPDILHCTSNTAPLFCNVPLVVTLHDIIFLEKQTHTSSSWYQNLGRLYRRLVVPRILNKSVKIITVSGFECERIRQALQLNDERITYIYNGFGSHFKPINDPFSITNKYTKEERYIFFLGNTDPKKNTRRTLLAYSIYLNRSLEKHPLLIADLSQEEIHSILDEQNIAFAKPYIHALGYIKNADLPAIYSGASVFLYTSLRESFGIPILESMACGTPIITSNTSAIPEIAGEGAILVDPTKEEEIAEQLLKIETDIAFRNRVVNYGLDRVKLFSWRNTALNTLKLYKQLFK